MESILPRKSSWFAAFMANCSATVASMFSLESLDWSFAGPDVMHWMLLDVAAIRRVERHLGPSSEQLL